MAGWLRKGDSARQERHAEEKRKEERENQVYRFWMPKGKETKITFLDGSLGSDGLMGQPIYYEHNLYLNGSWKNWFICTRDVEPCPLCMAGNNPAMVSPFSIIDHAEWVSKKDGTTHKNEIRLYIAKSATLKKLERKAEKLGGSIAGVTFEVFRSDDDKSASVGDDFELVERGELEALRAKYGKHVAAIDYEKAIPFMSADEMRAKGLGTAPLGRERNPEHALPKDGDIPF